MKPSFRKLSILSLCVVLISLCLSLSAHAETPSSDKWEFQLAPYAWLAGQNGKVATFPSGRPVDIDVDFYDDIRGNINGALMLVSEARKGHCGVLMDIAYTDIEFENPTPGPFFSSVSSRTKSWIVSAAGLYRLTDMEKGFLDVLGGLRYWSVESELSLGAGLWPAQMVTNKEDWVDPIIGIKGLSSLGESKFYTSGAFVVGGFGVGSDLMWDANLNLGYQWTTGFSTTIGYRYLDVDYEKDAFLYDVAQDGLILGLSWRF
jgi:hypothetical protein